VRFRRVVAVIVAAVTVVVAGTSIIRTVQSFYRVDFTIVPGPSGLHVEAVPKASTGDEAGVRDGDLIVGLDGLPIDRFDNPAFSLASGSDHVVEVRRADRSTERLNYHPPPPKIEEVYLARSLVGAFSLVCALIAVFSTTRRESLTFLLLAAASFLVGAIPHRTAAASPGLAVLHRSAGAAMSFLLFRFFAIFPHQDRRLRLLDTITVGAVIGAGLTPLVPDLQAWWPAILSGLRVLFNSALVFGIAVQIRRWWAAHDLERERRQIEWAGLGLFVGLTPLVSLVVVPGWLGIGFEPFSWMAVLPIAAIPLGFLAALTEYRLWDLEPISRDLVSATLVVASGGFIFSLMNFLLQTGGTGLGSLRNLLAFATGIILVLLIQPVRQRVEPFLDQWLHHGRTTPRQLLERSTRDLVSAEDPRVLLTKLGEILTGGLDVDPVATYVRTGPCSFERVFFGGSDELPAHLPTSLLDRPFPTDDEDPMVRAGFSARIPVERGRTTHAVLYLGLRSGVAPLGSEAEGVISAFAAQAALGLENARRLDELKQRAEEYRILHANTQRIIESSAAGILVCDAGGRILSANGGAAEIFDLPDRDLVGRRLDELLDLPENWRHQLPLHADNAEARTRRAPISRLILAVSVLELDAGSFNGRVVVAQDVTELRELQDRVRDQERLAGLGRLTAGLAHEINTPLTGIASYAQMLADMTPPDDPRGDLLDKLIGQSFRVSRIVANLRELFRDGGGERICLDVGEAVSRSAGEARRSVESGIRLELDLPDRPVTVRGTPGAIDLAVTNLVRNACEASPIDGVVRVRVLDGPEGPEITIDDEGPGIPEELKERVFQPFFTTKTDRGGTGLGLAITRDMISRIGGTVRLETLPEGGTRAVIRLEQCRQTSS